MIYKVDKDNIYTESAVAIGAIAAVITGLLAVKGIKKMSDAATKRKAEKSINKAICKYSNIKEFNKNNSIRNVDIQYIIDKIENKEEKESLNDKFYKCLIIENNNKEVTAYCIYADVDNYNYKILNDEYKKDIKIKHFILATFEYNLGIIGPGINHFSSKLKIGKQFTNINKNKSIHEVSKEEFDEIKNLYNDLAKDIKNKLNNVSGYHEGYESDYKEDNGNEFSGYWSKILYLDDSYIDYDKLYRNDDFNNSYYDQIIEKMNNDIDKIISRFGKSEFDIKEISEGFYLTYNKCKMIRINLEPKMVDDDDGFYIEVTIYTTSVIKVK